MMMNKIIPPNPWKVIVTVNCVYDKDKGLIPKSLVWEDEKLYEIDKVVDVRNAASLKAGGIGVRYECMISGQKTYLFFEKDHWFVERK